MSTTVNSSIAILVKTIVKAIVDHDQDVQVTEVRGSHSIILELTVHPNDLGKVIGRQGVHADAIRTIVHAASGKEKKRYVLEILDPK